MKNKGKKFIIGVVLCALGVVGLFGLFTNTNDKAALAAGSVILIVAGIVLLVLSKKFPDKPKENTKNKNSESIVFITKSGDKYHIDPSCPGLDNSIRIPLDKAKKKGYTACSKCKYSYLNTSHDSE